MEIRTIRRNELDQLCRLYDQLVPGDVNYEAMCRTYDAVCGDSDFHLVGVFQADSLIATATLTRCLDLTGDTRFYYSMENFVVDEAHRRTGVGTYLMSYLEDYVTAHNGRYMNFTSSAARTGAHRFYGELGYAPDYVKGFKKTFPAATEEV